MLETLSETRNRPGRFGQLVAAGGGLSSISLLIAVSASRLLCGLAIVKALSYILGPTQFGTISQVMGVCAVFYGFAGGGVTNGLILYSGRETDASEQRRWLAAALAIGVAASTLLAITSILLGVFGAFAVLGQAARPGVFVGIAVAQAVIGVGNILLAYASGIRDLRSFALASIIGTLAWALITVAATLTLGYTGSIWAVILAPAATAFVIVAILWQQLYPYRALLVDINRSRVLRLLQASGFMAIAVSALPLAQTFIRANLAQHTSWHDVGLWQSVARLSDAYMQVFGVICINLLLPRLLQRPGFAGRNGEIMRTGGAMLALFLCGAIVLYGLREPVVRLAFSSEFLPAAAYIAPQLAADFAKVGAWILVYRFVAAGHLWAQPAAEVFQAIGVVVFYLALLPTQGALAPVFGHLLSCIALLCALGIVAWRFRK